MTGQAIYRRYNQEALSTKPGSDVWTYAQTLRTAYAVVGPEILYPMLEEAERTGQQIELTYPISPEEGLSEPTGIRLVA